MDARVWMLASVGIILLWSLVGVADLPTWLFELVVGLAGIGILATTYSRFRFSSVVYIVAVFHFLVLAIGAKYTYAEAPIGFWIQDILGLDRNPFDRIGHFMQGFTPALVSRELLLRTTKLKSGKMLSFLIVSISLAFSAFYEIVEWWVVVLFYPNAGPEWLGMQGDPFDAQADMLMAVIGAILALLLLSRLQARQMRHSKNTAL